jgi:hypothetical protein
MADGKHYNQLNIATVIFDDNGNYLTNGGKIVELACLIAHLKDGAVRD